MEKTVRMLHVFPSFLQGGTELRIIRVLNGLPFPARHTILALDGRFAAAANFASGIQFELVTKPGPRGGFSGLRELRGLILRSNPDLLLTYNWGAIEAVLAGRLSARCAIIHNESGFGTDEANSRKSRRVWARRLLLSGIHTTIVNSQTLLNIARTEYKLPAGKINLIRNGIDVKRFVPGRNDALRDQLGAGPDTVIFGFIGKHREEKNVAMMVEAFAATKLSNAILVLVGDGPCRRQLESLAQRVASPGRIVFPGEVQDPVPYLQAFDVFVISSFTEQTPNALLEAMACGLPAIGTDVGDIGEILTAGDAPVTVHSADVAAMSRSMQALAENPDLRARLAAQNRQRCVERYSLDRMVHEFSAIYQGAIR